MNADAEVLPKSDFRQGRRVPRNVYHGDEPLFMAATDELAAELVVILNAGAAVLRASQKDGAEASGSPPRSPMRMEGPWPRRPHLGKHPDGSQVRYDLLWIKDWRTFTGRTIREAMEAHKLALYGRMAEGCCSAISPCSHQQRDPYSLCLSCRGVQDRAEASATEAVGRDRQGSVHEGAAPSGETPSHPSPIQETGKGGGDA